jgi:hypothetical protein
MPITMPNLFPDGVPLSSSSAYNNIPLQNDMLKSDYMSGSPIANGANLSSLDVKLEDLSNDSRSVMISKLIAVAKGELGVVERGTINNQGPGIEKYWSATLVGSNAYNYITIRNGKEGAPPYCAAYVCWCVKQANIIPEQYRPKEAYCPNWPTWSSTTGKNYSLRIDNPREFKRGDIVIFRKSHIGIILDDFVFDINKKEKTMTIIEGNTGPDKIGSTAVVRDARVGVGGIYIKKRTFAAANITCAIRLYPNNTQSNNQSLASVK